MEEKLRTAYRQSGKEYPGPPRPAVQPGAQPVAGNRQEGAAREGMRLAEDYVASAERVMAQMFQNNLIRQGFTTSKIRNILSMVSELYNELLHDKDETLKPEYVERIRYLRVRLVYESGRESAVGAFVRGANLIEYLKGIGESRAQFIRYARYMEALVAYHRFLGGKDK